MFYINNNIEVSEKLKDIRLRNKVSQKEIANAVGKSLGYISNIENNVTRRIETDVVRYYLRLEHSDSVMIENELQNLMNIQKFITEDELEKQIKTIFANIFDSEREYAERKLMSIGTNIKFDSSLMFAYMSVNISILSGLSYSDKKEFLKDVKNLVDKYSKINITTVDTIECY